MGNGSSNPPVSSGSTVQLLGTGMWSLGEGQGAISRKECTLQVDTEALNSSLSCLISLWLPLSMSSHVQGLLRDHVVHTLSSGFSHLV